MAITHIGVLATTLLVLLCLPCVVAVVVCADELVARRSGTGRRDLHALRCLERALGAGGVEPPPPACEPSIDELVADLRRLDRQRRRSPTIDSAAWLAAVLRAYDQRLAMASQALGLTEHLAQLDGMDRELERVRVEEILHAAGLRVRSA